MVNFAVLRFLRKILAASEINEHDRPCMTLLKYKIVYKFWTFVLSLEFLVSVCLKEITFIHY